MSNYTEIQPITNLTPASTETQATSNKDHKKDADVNFMALAYYYLVESETTSAESAIGKAKELNSNAMAQEQLNGQMGQLKWNYVPKEDVTHHNVYIRHIHSRWVPTTEGPVDVPYCTYQKIVQTDIKNQGQVDYAEEANQNISAERTFLTQKMTVLQQVASVQETHVNSITDESSQTMQEASSILQIIKSLTFKALMRSPPQF